jgi:hypothetical protein
MDLTEKAFQYASEASKLVTTLSTAVITFTTAFSKELPSVSPASTSEKILLLLAWLALFTSAASGIWVHLALVSVFEPPEKPNSYSPTIRTRKIMVPFQIGLGTFVLGMFLLLLYGIIKNFFLRQLFAAKQIVWRGKL